MLSWICPDCGCDCAPTDQECPDCSDLVQAGMVALARAVEEHRNACPQLPVIPIQDRVAAPPPSIVPRAALALVTLRCDEPLPEDMPASPPLLPVLSAASEQPVMAIPPPPEQQPVKQRAMLPGGLISVMVATNLSLGGAAIIRNMESDHKAQAASTQPASTSDANIEVTALRVLGGPRYGSHLQYVVVNHSSTALSNARLRIDVLSTSASRPLFTMNVTVTELAAFASREMTTAIQDAQATEIPDWGHLKADVQLLGQ